MRERIALDFIQASSSAPTCFAPPVQLKVMIGMYITLRENIEVTNLGINQMFATKAICAFDKLAIGSLDVNIVSHSSQHGSPVYICAMRHLTMLTLSPLCRVGLLIPPLRCPEHTLLHMARNWQHQPLLRWSHKLEHVTEQFSFEKLPEVSTHFLDDLLPDALKEMSPFKLRSSGSDYGLQPTNLPQDAASPHTVPSTLPRACSLLQ